MHEPRPIEQDLRQAILKHYPDVPYKLREQVIGDACRALETYRPEPNLRVVSGEEPADE